MLPGHSRISGSRADRRARARDRAGGAEDRCAGSGVRHGPAQGAVARVWLKPGSGRTTVNGAAISRSILRGRCSHADQSAVRGRPSRAAVRPDLHRRRRRLSGRPAQCATASAAPWSPTIPCSGRPQGRRVPHATRARSSVRSMASARPAAASSSPSVEPRPGGSCRPASPQCRAAAGALGASADSSLGDTISHWPARSVAHEQPSAVGAGDAARVVDRHVHLRVTEDAPPPSHTALAPST